MNISKARDFYSDYYEGTLDASLKQVFERALASDSEIRADYNEFCALMEEMSSLQEVTAPEPNFLHERIMTRIDEVNAAHAQSAGPWWQRFWKPLAIAGVAGAAIIGTIMSINSTSSGGKVIGGVFGGAGSSKMPELSLRSGELHLTFKSASKVDVEVKKGDGELVQVYNLDSAAQDIPLKSERESAELLKIEFSNGMKSLQVVMPGIAKPEKEYGSGTVLDMAKALADTYGRPVQFEVKNPSEHVDWDFAGRKDAIDAVNGKMGGLSLEDRANGPLYLTDN